MPRCFVHSTRITEEWKENLLQAQPATNQAFRNIQYLLFTNILIYALRCSSIKLWIHLLVREAMFERRLSYPPNMLFFLPRPDVIVSIHAAITMQSHSQPRVGCDQQICPFYLCFKSCRVCQMQRENILKILIMPSNNKFEKHLYPHKSV